MKLYCVISIGHNFGERFVRDVIFLSAKHIEFDIKKPMINIGTMNPVIGTFSSCCDS